MSEATKKKPWTQKHVDAALRRTYEIAILLVDEGRAFDAALACIGLDEPARNIASERAWRTILSEASVHGARADREVRLVRARAEGREVKDPPEVFFRVRLSDGSYLADAETDAPTHDPREAWAPRRGESADQSAMAIPGARVVRVTLKRTRILRKAKTS